MMDSPTVRKCILFVMDGIAVQVQFVSLLEQFSSQLHGKVAKYALFSHRDIWHFIISTIVHVHTSADDRHRHQQKTKDTNIFIILYQNYCSKSLNMTMPPAWALVLSSMLHWVTNRFVLLQVHWF